MSDTNRYELLTLATMPEDAAVNETRLAELLQVDKRTVRRMVARGELPPGQPLGRHKMWLVGRIREFWHARAERFEAEETERRKHITMLEG